MKRLIAALLVMTFLLLTLSACQTPEPTSLYFTISAEAAVTHGETLPAIHREITFPLSALETKTVMFAILYACDALGYEHVREGKYNENLVSVAGRANQADAYWAIEATYQDGRTAPVTTDSTLDGMVRLSITYQKKA
jgi:hypothetical protein